MTLSKHAMLELFGTQLAATECAYRECATRRVPALRVFAAERKEKKHEQPDKNSSALGNNTSEISSRRRWRIKCKDNENADKISRSWILECILDGERDTAIFINIECNTISLGEESYKLLYLANASRITICKWH